MDGPVPANEAAGYSVGVDDEHGTTWVYAYVRRRITPKVLWSAIVVLFGALVTTITLDRAMRSDIRGIEKTVARLEDEIKAAAASRDEDRKSLEVAKTQLAVQASQIGTLTADERERWGRVDHALGKRH